MPSWIGKHGSSSLRLSRNTHSSCIQSYVLNFKGISYQTVWVEGSKIESVCKRIGANPTSRNSDGSPCYTVPVIHDPNTDRIVSDSAVIAEYLDITYPGTPAVFPDGSKALQMAFQYAFRQATLMPLVLILSMACMRVLDTENQLWYRKGREEWLGLKLEDMSPPGEKRLGQFKDLENALAIVGSWYDKSDQSGGGFIMGDVMSYADITVCSWLMWAKKTLGEQSEEWSRILSWHDRRWARLMDRLSKYEVS
jgi:glutathione S-transferase